ncbi:MAG: PilN domain-containing protein [Rubrivivax sp.]|nr:PilN domain-containing protein [Rubrivivax sp.]MBK7263858.1 PilN domain-containing protein [Rubrivivax sp.]MBK8525862.1 PilN domain-containing protein [Rubrivivax sp.]
MILINLLPHREAKRRQRKQAFFVGVAAAVVVGLVIAGIWYMVLQQLMSNQMARSQFLKDEITRLDLQIKDIASLRAEIEALKARQKAVEDLQTDRNTPVRLLDELVKQTPEGVYITSIKEVGYQVEVIGIAQTNERVSELLRNLLYNSAWLEQPDLVEIKSVLLPTGGKDKEMRRLFQYQLKVRIKQPPAPAAAAAATPAASAPVKAS